MANRSDLIEWVKAGITENGGSATILQVAEHIWRVHEHELRQSGSLFYTWQYDMRWAALSLRKSGVIRATDRSAKGVWELA